MAAGQLRKWLSADWCFAGLILFFIVHGYSEYQFLVPFKELLLLTLFLLAAGAIVYFLFKRIFRNGRKAAIFITILFTIILFFGDIQDFLAGFRFLSSITRLTVLLPVLLVLLVVLFIWLRKTKLSFNRTIFFLNTLLLLYVIVDLFIISYRFADPPQNRLSKYGLQRCDTCSKPPVYLILLDSYFGSAGLKSYFRYDNAVFENFLKGQGFHINNATSSNYVFTIYSMASLLNMDYLHGIGEPVIKNHYGFYSATASMNNNLVTRYFTSLGYRINNYSGFDMPGVPAGYNSGFFPDKIRLITHKTLYYRVKKYLPLFLVRMGWIKEAGDDIENEFIRNNEEMMKRTLAESKNTTPAFTYLHLMMPHRPYVYDSTGNRTHFLQRQASLSKEQRDQVFLQYQVYTNKKITEFISDLQKQTGGNAVILLMSDHGYQAASRKEKKLAFYNLNAVYLPSKKYEAWYEGISNVNQFRVLFNTLYGQQLPMVKDSIVTE